MRLKYYVISVWSLLDPIYFFCTRLNYVERLEKNRSIFRVRLTRYKGSKITLSDGTIIKKNDFLIKIHLHNVQLLKDLHSIDNDYKRAIVLYNKVKDSLPQLALYVQGHQKAEEIKGIMGITSLNKGCKRLGFETYPIISPTYKWFKKLSQFPINLLSKSNSSSSSFPMYLFMKKEHLINKYKIS